LGLRGLAIPYEGLRYSLFRRVFIRKNNKPFPKGTVEKISRNGDLINQVFLEVELPALQKSYLTDPVANSDYAELSYTNAIGHGKGSDLRMLADLRFPHSLGLLYSAFTQYLGFKVNNGEYKVMGLAPYGDPTFEKVIRDHLIDIREDGSYALNMDYFDYLAGDSTINEAFDGLFRQPRRTPEAELATHHMNVARSIQAVTETIVLRQAATAKRLTGCRQLVMAGGVALNSVANGKLAASGLFDDLWIQPAAGDAGGAVGAAYIAWHRVQGAPRTPPFPDGMSGGYLGPSFDGETIDAALSDAGLEARVLPSANLDTEVAQLLDEGNVVGWFQGRMEFGPRALGHRSILADPRKPEMQARVNAKIKFREGFRPFAPSVLAEEATQKFNLDRPSPYMLLVVPVHDDLLKPLSESQAQATGLARLKVERSALPAITHVDNSARVQTVQHNQQPRYHQLLRAFFERTGSPVLLNTSFNLRGEPVVCTPGDAIATFLASGMDALVLNDRLVLRPEGHPPTGAVPAPPHLVRPKTTRHLRTFGLGAGAIFLTLAGLQVLADHATVALVLGLLGAFFALPGALAPRTLVPVEAQFARVGKVLGHFNATVLLSLLYWLVVTPIAWLKRRGGDPLADPRPPLEEGSLFRAADPVIDEVDRAERLY